MSIARSSRPLRSMTIGTKGMSAVLLFGMGERGPAGGRGRSGRRDVLRLCGRDVADDLVDDPVLLGLDRRQVAVALRVLGDRLVGLAGVLGEDLVDVSLVVHNLPGLDLDVGD